MFLSTVFLLFIFIPQNDTNLEQIALDYFFESILRKDFPEYKIVEMNDSTYSEHYWGIVHRCEGWSDSLVKDIIAAEPGSSKKLNAEKSPVKVKKLRKNSSRLKVMVYSSIRIGDQSCVMISVHRKWRFVEYYYLIFDSSDNLIDYCNVGVII